ncbi:MAG: enoyl-CoA hydratase [Actinomycetota bacterium]|nr:enoyl-CoA hydratase [Actinomycetota bacterium]
MTLVLVDKRDRVAVVTLNDPDRRNSLSGPMVDEIVETFDALEADDGVGAVVITGAGPGFCAGADLGNLGGTTGPGFRSIYEGFLRVGRSTLPTLAAVNGAAVGAGMNLALACDLRVAGKSAKFDCRFLDLGLHPGGGHTWMLRDAVGKANAAAMVLFGQILRGEDAERAGLVWRCVDDASLIDASVEIAARAASGPKELVVEIKRSLADMRAIDDANSAMERELGPQVWSREQPWFAERLAAIRARVQKK